MERWRRTRAPRGQARALPAEGSQSVVISPSVAQRPSSRAPPARFSSSGASMPKQYSSPTRSPTLGATPRSVMPLNMQALATFEDEFLHSPSVVPSHAGVHSPALKRPTSAAAALDLCATTCNFEDFSRHFHLPLKAAAEKFGVRATAFKKRCRAIGIRHWPYRKVRSLKRSLQELARAQEEADVGEPSSATQTSPSAGAGAGLTDKQRRQLSAFQKQLSTLLAPETYGIDPSGRLNVPAPFDDADNDMDDSQLEEDDDADSDSAYASPRPSAAEALSFGSSFRAAVDVNREMMMAMANAPSHLRTFRRQSAYHDPSMLSAAAFSATLYAMPTTASASNASSKLVFGWPDSYYFNEEVMRSVAAAGEGATSSTAKSDATTASGDEQDVGQGSPSESNSSASTVAGSENHLDTTDFLTAEIKFEEVRSLRGGIEDDATFGEPAGGHIDYSSERFFDDVFLQISPDYGCLVRELAVDRGRPSQATA